MFTQKSKKLIKLFVISYISYMSCYAARMNLTAASAALQEQGIFKESQYGSIGSLFFVFYAVGRLINGTLGDHLRPRAMIVCGTTLIALCNLLLGLLPSFPIFAAAWAVNGFAQSMLYGPLLKNLTKNAEADLQSKIASWLVSSICVGSILGLMVGFFAASLQVIRLAFIIPGSIAFFASVIILLFYDDSLCKSNEKLQRSLLSTIRAKEITSIMIPTLLHGVIKDNLSLWVVLYFTNVYHVDSAVTSLFVFAVPVTGLAARLCYPTLYKMCGSSEFTVNIAMFSVLGLAMLPLVFSDSPIWAAAILICCVSTGIQAINTSVLAIYPLRFQKSENVSQVTGILDFYTYIGAGIGAMVYGIVVERTGFRFVFGSWVFISLLSIGYLIRAKHVGRSNI